MNAFNRFAHRPLLLLAMFLATFLTTLAGASFIQADISEGQYLLKTAYQGEDNCLDGNRFAPESTLGGSAFMSSCIEFAGQLFNIEAAQKPGFFLLKTDFMGDDYCLHGNRVSPNATLRGAAFMAPCYQSTSGQLWWMEPYGDGYVLLKTLHRGQAKCLEGNNFDANATLSGAAFMASCDDPADGQLWKLEQL
ncbi:MAG: hypothetical protein ACI8WB_000199 [Phenylobacterium sp.]|jgi:hypothetical protein